MLAIEVKNIFTYLLFPNIDIYISVNIILKNLYISMYNPAKLLSSSYSLKNTEKAISGLATVQSFLS